MPGEFESSQASLYLEGIEGLEHRVRTLGTIPMTGVPHAQRSLQKGWRQERRTTETELRFFHPAGLAPNSDPALHNII